MRASWNIRLVLGLVTLGGCVDRQEKRLDERQEETEVAMVDHSQDALAMRQALVKGQREEAMAALDRLRARLPLKVLSPKGHLAQKEFITAVNLAATSPDLPSLAQSYGAMLQACGECHRSTGVRVEVALPAPAAPDSPTVARMAVHGQASQAMVMALVAADEPAFVQAAAILREASLVPDGLDPSGTLPPMAIETGVRLGDLAAQAGSAEGRHGELMGEILSTCASCHSLAGRGGG